jgi:hypothetical protein
MGKDSDPEVATSRKECFDAGTCTRLSRNVGFAMADGEKKFMQKKKALGLWREIMRAIISTSIDFRITSGRD